MSIKNVLVLATVVFSMAAVALAADDITSSNTAAETGNSSTVMVRKHKKNKKKAHKKAAKMHKKAKKARKAAPAPETTGGADMGNTSAPAPDSNSTGQ